MIRVGILGATGYTALELIKILLRHPQATSSLEDCASGRFQRVIVDDKVKKPARVLLCSGKVYYEIEKRRAELGREDVAIVRIEQLYPLPDAYWWAALDQCDAPFCGGFRPCLAEQGGDHRGVRVDPYTQRSLFADAGNETVGKHGCHGSSPTRQRTFTTARSSRSRSASSV